MIRLKLKVDVAEWSVSQTTTEQWWKLQTYVLTVITELVNRFIKCFHIGFICVYALDIVINCAIMKLNSLTVGTLFAVVIYTCVIVAKAKVNEHDILLLNKPLTVDFGRTALLDPIYTLRLNVRSGDTCRVTVVDNNEELIYSPGRLSKSEFSCNFGPEEIKYIHYGGNGQSEDTIQILLRYVSHTDNITTIIPFSTPVYIRSKSSEILSYVDDLTVDRNLGLSTPIDPLILGFSYDKSVYRCVISVVSPSFGLPQYGQLLNNTNPVTNVDCEIFITLGVTYKHTAEPRSMNVDFIPVNIRLLENDGEVFIEEYVQLQVNIKSGRRNTPPRPSENANFIMDSFNQITMTAITPDVVSATDAETPSDRLLFKVTQSLGPGEGHIINTDNRNTPITSFYQHDINNLKIAYRPPTSDSSIQRIVQLGLTISDPHGLSSDPIQMMIIVKPRNPLAPYITKNVGIQLFEGGHSNLSLDILGFSDKDDLRDVTINHIHGMSNGFLMLSTGNSYFTYEDLRRRRVQYHHDGSDTTSDNVVFSMSDGRHEVEFLFPVTVYPVDNNPPGLVINAGIDVQKHGLVAVTSNILSATDKDTDDAHLTFVLEKPFSTSSMLMKRQVEIPFNVQGWHFDEGFYEKTVTAFTQKDIYEGKVFYKYIGAQNQNSLSDSFKFHLVDYGKPPNKSPSFQFNIKIHPIDDIPPHVTSNFGLQMEAGSARLVQIKRKILRYSDDGTSDRDITYIIKGQPVDANNESATDAGFIVNCDVAGRRLYRFSQADVNHQKVCYQPPAGEFGITTKLVQLWFDVIDEAGNKLENQHFNIILKPASNQPPSIFNSGATVMENGQVVINTGLLRVDDADTPLNNLIYKMSKTPKHGAVYNDGQYLTVGATFGNDDIKEGRIVYANTGQNRETHSDSFTVDVIDGPHVIPVSFKVIIKSIEEEMTHVETSARNGKMILRMQLYEKQSMTVGPEHFRFAMIDDISYIVKRHPQFGELLRHGSPSSFFTQSDVIEGLMKFQLSDRETGRDAIEDYVQLTFADSYNILLPDDSALTEINVRFRILPVDNSKPEITVLQDLLVAEGEQTAILPTHFEAIDVDSIEDDILCVIVEQPRNGFVEKTNSDSTDVKQGQPISSFSVGDVRAGNIYYVQSIHRSVEPRQDKFNIQCTDGKNTANPVQMNVVIRSKNDEEPNVAVRGFRINEGGEIVIDTPVINAVDGDEPEDILTAKITREPKHGAIIRKSRTGKAKVQNFTLDNIESNSAIFYVHDDSESKVDSFEIVVTDGVHEVRKVVPIDIIPVDDEAPRLIVNSGLVIDNIKEQKVITNDNLKAEDVDSLEDNITFIIERVPQYGYLIKAMDGGVKNMTYSANFTQNEIDRNMIHYVHTGSEATRDVITFHVTDGINTLPDRSFQVTIKGLDVIYPDVISRGVRLSENGAAVLTPDVLGVSDGIAASEDSKFIVTEPPVHGHIEFVNQTGIAVQEFTYHVLKASRVMYIHAAEDAIKVDSFEMEVYNGVKKVTQTYRIALTSIDNKMPVVMFSNLRLEEGGNKVITSRELKAVDMDSDDEQIIFTITQVPLHGNLIYNYSRIVTRFSQKDVNTNLITYQHDGTETMSDSFIFTVTDGTHVQYFIHGSSIPTRRPQELDIVIIPVDSGIPNVKVNKGAMSLSPVDIGVGFTFSSEHLQCVDKDSVVEKLRYTLSVPPKHGFIRNTNKGGLTVLQWTQGMLNSCLLK